MYADSDGIRKEEIDILGGNKNLIPQDISRTPDIWNNYYDKIREIKVLNKNLHSYSELVENNTPEKLFNSAFEQITTHSIFTAEENKGKSIDIHDIFMSYQNLKNVFIAQLTKIIFLQLKDMRNYMVDDYLTFLSEFDK